MPGNPRECRAHALECMELARRARTPEHKQLLTGLAQSWMHFAAGIERAQVLWVNMTSAASLPQHQ